MTFVSFAQNFEDVMLWRALRHVERGFYVDVGAAHPDIDSVTRAFYERDWRGINIEPVASAHRRLEASRPRDINLNLALGAAPGLANFFVLEGTGLSTLDRQVAETLQRQAIATSSVTVQVDTLARVMRQHAPAEVHFLKIDVEGAEQGVLAGADFTRTRPWIVVVEATAPLSTVETHAAWEPLLLEAGYRFVWFDGLNRFYLAEERHGALAQHFRVPVNVFDDVLRAADTEWARRIHEAEVELRALRERILTQDSRLRQDSEALAQARAGLLAQGDLARQMSDIRRSMADATSQTRAAETRARNAEQQAQSAAQQAQSAAQHVQAAEQQAQTAEQRAQSAEAWLARMHTSTSWRITAPLRQLARPIARLRGRSRSAVSMPDVAARQPVPPATSVTPPITTGTSAPRPLDRGAGRRVVHQFHPGSAAGDAITNSMLLVRRLLREMGYASEIFVEHVAPELAAELRPMSRLPEHDGYVLIVRVSLGHAGFNRIASLPAPKVLMYHNITPAELLAGAPVLQDFARLGRNQLTLWRPHVAAALADSVTNATELRNAGFDAPLVCPLLFDIDAMQTGGRPDPDTQPGAPFTMLFVGRMMPFKGQDALIEAFALFARSFAGPCRLILVGALPAETDPYLRHLRGLIDEAGLPTQVTLTGQVSDAELLAWYDRADLYVSLSQHEGFGVPLVEAMARFVPVLAWPCAAVPLTLGGTAELLDSREPGPVSQRMLDLAHDPHRRRTIAIRQMASLDRFRLERHLPALIQALASAGAALPPQRDLRPTLARQLSFAVTGHANGSYSLAAVNRTLAQMLEATRPGRVRFIAVEGSETADLSGVPTRERDAIVALTRRAKPPAGPEIVISQHYPLHTPPDPGDAALALFAWEESVVPAETVRALNAGFRAVLVPSRFVAKALVDSGLRRPVHVIGHAPPLAGFVAAGLARGNRSTPRASFTFLHVSSCLPRKGVDLLLAAFASAFRKADPVRLVIKGVDNPHNDTARRIAELQDADAEAPEIVLINTELDEAAMLALFRDADAMVLPTRGEGFNLPAAEAMAARLPLIVTNRGGHMDFCDTSTARLLDSRMAPSRSHVASGGSLWSEAAHSDLVTALRELAAPDPQMRDLIAARVDAAASRVLRCMTPSGLVHRIEQAALDALTAPPPPPVRIAFVSSWDVRCGIAEYSRHLLSHFSADDIAELTLIADHRCTSPAWRAPFGDQVAVRQAWQIGSPGPEEALGAAIATADPDVVVIQHQPGLLEWSALARLIEAPDLAGRPICITLHNTNHLLEQGPKCQPILAALRRCARVLVHTLADVNRLAASGLADNVTLLPHGAPAAMMPGEPAPRLLPNTAGPVIGCTGFFLPHKGIAALISAVALLRATWPRVRLRLVNAEYNCPESRAEIAACRELAAAAGLSNAIDWHTGFLTTAESQALLAGCDLLVLPYQETMESSSAALRMALSARVPVAVTPLPIFDDAADAVARFAGITPLDIALGIEALLIDPTRRAAQLVAADAWLADHAWPIIAQRFQGMITGVARHRPPSIAL
jgi:FkbM family methyltransferase